MATLYIAVIFYCVNGACDFMYSPKMYNLRGECTVDVGMEITKLQKVHPDVKLGAACLEFKIPSA